MTDATDATDATDSIVLVRNDKRERKHTAQTLPPGITHKMMKKFVVYYREMTYLKSGKQQPREYFKVESHPKLSKPWVSSKSVKIPLFEKLNHANQVVADLESQSEKDTGLAVAETHQEEEEEEEEESITRVIERWSKQIPRYMMLRVGKAMPTPTTALTLIYDRKDNQHGFRWTSSHTFSVHSIKDADATISTAIATLREKLQSKYGVDIVSI